MGDKENATTPFFLSSERNAIQLEKTLQKCSNTMLSDLTCILKPITTSVPLYKFNMQTFDNFSNAVIDINSPNDDVTINQKIDDHSRGTIICHDLTIGQKIDQHCKVTITAANLIIDQGISQHCTVRYRVTGTANLGQIDGNCDVQRF